MYSIKFALNFPLADPWTLCARMCVCVCVYQFLSSRLNMIYRGSQL